MTLTEALHAAYVTKTSTPLVHFSHAELAAARANFVLVMDRCHIARVTLEQIDRALANG